MTLENQQIDKKNKHSTYLKYKKKCKIQLFPSVFINIYASVCVYMTQRCLFLFYVMNVFISKCIYFLAPDLAV